MEPEWSEFPPEGAEKEGVTVHGVDGSLASLEEAVKGQPNGDKLKAQILALVTILTKYGSRHLMTNGQLVTESVLPDESHSYALKKVRKPMRAYGWWSKKLRGCFIISHFAYKNTEKMASADKKRVSDNWSKFENGETPQ